MKTVVELPHESSPKSIRETSSFSPTLDPLPVQLTSANRDERLASSPFEDASASNTGISSPTPGSVTGVSVCCEARDVLDIDMNEMFDVGRLDDKEATWSPEELTEAAEELAELEALTGIDTGDDVVYTSGSTDASLAAETRSTKLKPRGEAETEMLEPQLDSVPVPVSEAALGTRRPSQLALWWWSSSPSSVPRTTTFAGGRFLRFLIFLTAAGSSGLTFGASIGSGSDARVSNAPTLARW
jgi:hypothetical protein